MAMPNELLRPTFIVSDIEAAIRFYTFVFDWTVVFDQVIKVDKRFPPAAPDGARSRLTVFQVDDPELGTLGFMQYLDHEIAPGPSKHRKALAQGEAILVIRAADPDLCHERIKQTDAVVIGPPADWDVVGENPGEVIRLRTMSLCDPNGIYIEVNRRGPGIEMAKTQSLKSQTSTPQTPAQQCFMIVLGAFTDFDRFMATYQVAVAPLIAKYGGQYDLIGADLAVLEGAFPAGGGAVISRWPDRAAALRFWNSPDYAEVKKLREGTGEFQVVLIDAV